MGCIFSFKFACDLSQNISVIATVAASMPVDLKYSCRSSRQLKLVMLNGNSDKITPFYGGALSVGKRGYTLSVPETASFWAGVNQCSNQVVKYKLPNISRDGTLVKLHKYQNCPFSGNVNVLKVLGGGHTCFGGAEMVPKLLVGRTSKDIDASYEIAKFFNLIKDH